MSGEAIYTRIRRFGDGGGVSSQEYTVLTGPPPGPNGEVPADDLLTDTGIVQHWRIYSSAPKGETEDSQHHGPSDLGGIEERTYEYAGKFYATLERALEARNAGQS